MINFNSMRSIKPSIIYFDLTRKVSQMFLCDFNKTCFFKEIEFLLAIKHLRDEISF